METKDGSVFVEYPEFTLEYRDASHRYWILQDNERTAAPSVTTILGVLDKGGLLHWAERCGAEGAAILAREGDLEGVAIEDVIQRVRAAKLGMIAKRDEAADRGTLVHSVLESWGRDGTVPNVTEFPAAVRGYVQGLCGWLLRANLEPVAIETMVASTTHGFAGRFDLFADHRGAPVLYDLKTSAKAIVWDSAHLQVAGLMVAMRECGFDGVGNATLVAVGEDGGFTEVDCDASGDEFLSVFAAYRAVQRLRALRSRRERDV